MINKAGDILEFARDYFIGFQSLVSKDCFKRHLEELNKKNKAVMY